MSKFLSLFILASSTLILISSVAFSLNHYLTQKSTSVEKNISVYADINNEPKYALGECIFDSECFVGGCSGQICSNDEGVITTCEIRDDFPDKNIYSCGCINKKCAWYKK